VEVKLIPVKKALTGVTLLIELLVESDVVEGEDDEDMLPDVT